MKANELLNKGCKKVMQWAKRYGYVTVCDYEENENTVVEFAKVTAGITSASLTVVFNKAWRVIEIR